jgi:VCBS repeat protein
VYIFINNGTNKQPVYHEGKRLKSSSTGKDIAIKFNPKLNFADMNGDGSLDIILGSYDGKPYMLPNESKNPGNFIFDDHKYTTFKTKTGVLDVGNYVYPFVVDWNKDGLMDIITGEIEGKVHLYINKGTKSEPFFKAPIKIASIAPDMYPDPVLIDISGDAKRDLILGSRSGKIYFFKNYGSDKAPKFTKHNYLQADGKDLFVGRLSHIHLKDWNDDGIIDLLVGNDHGEVRVYRGKTKGAETVFMKALLLKTEKEVELISKVHPVVSFGDWNGDGKIDIIAGGEGPELRFFPNIGTKGKAKFDDYKLIPGVEMDAEAFKYSSSEEKSFWDNPGLEFITEYLGNAAPEIVDWDNDGKLDLLLGSYSGLIYFFKNTGTKTKPRLGKPEALKAGGKLLLVGGFSTPRAVDWNADGKLDLISGDLLGRIYVFINKGSKNKPVLTKGRMIKVGDKSVMLTARSMVEVADLNNDNLKDLIVGNRFGRVYALLNTGSAKIPEFAECEVLQDKSTI